MKLSLRHLWLILALLASASKAPAADIVDVPPPVYETEIEAIQNLPGKMSWIDANTLVATTYGSADDDFTIRKVVAFDVRTQATKTIVEFGSIECVNADKNLMSVLTGTLEKGFKGDSTAADPVSKFFSWNAQRSTLTAAGTKFEGAWNHSLCLPTSKEDIGVVSLPFQDTDSLYLQPEHGRVAYAFGNGSMNSADRYERSLVLRRAGAPDKKLDVTKEEIAQVPAYLPFLNSYVLRPGLFLTGGAHFSSKNGEPETERALLLLSPSGNISRVSAPQELIPLITGAAEALFLPTPEGTVAMVGSWPAQGGGIYVINKNGARRVWCLPELADDPKASCGIQGPIELSPDGCKVAFFSRFMTKSAHRRFHTRPTIKIVKVCSAR